MAVTRREKITGFPKRLLVAVLAASVLGVGLIAPVSVQAQDDAGSDDAGSEDASPEFDPFSVYEWAADGSTCSVDSHLVAAVARAASNHGDIDGHSFDDEANIVPPLFGQSGDGSLANLAVLPDTDGGVIDGDSQWDRPVGPFQLLPSSWLRYGFDANNDGVADPQNLWDAAGSAANFLCAMGAGSDGADREAIRNYAGSDLLAGLVLSYYAELESEADVLGATLVRPDDKDFDLASFDLGGPDDVLVLTAEAFAEIEDLTIISMSSLIADPVPVADGELSSGRVSRISDGSLVVEPLELSARGGVLRGDWDEDGMLDAGLFDGNRFFLSTGSVVEFGQLGDKALVGDWDGDGIPTPAVWRTVDGPTGEPEAEFIPADADGRPFGARVRLVDVEAVTPLIGDWDGDGRDSLAVRRPVDEDNDVVEFYDRFGIADIAPVELEGDAIALVTPTSLREPLGLADATAMEMVELNAQLPPIQAPDGSELQLIDVRNIRVAVSVADQVAAMVDSAAADGISLTGWGWRSHERQIELRIANCADVFDTPPSECSPPTARPGTSRHEFGLAIDFHVELRAISSATPEFAWLTENAHRFGFFNLPSEPWHWSVDGR